METLLERGAEGDLAEAQQRSTGGEPARRRRLGDAEITLLRLRALLARARGDDVAYRDLVNRYREMAESLGFEGHIDWAKTMVEGPDRPLLLENWCHMTGVIRHQPTPCRLASIGAEASGVARVGLFKSVHPIELRFIEVEVQAARSHSLRISRVMAARSRKRRPGAGVDSDAAAAAHPQMT